MSCINITWCYRDYFLVIYDTQSGITIEDALMIHNNSPMFMLKHIRYSMLRWPQLINDHCIECMSLNSTHTKDPQGCYANPHAYSFLQIYICTHSKCTHISPNSYKNSLRNTNFIMVKRFNNI
jgi:hypothetical protein